MALACVAGRAEAADARLRVAIPPRSYADALIDLGIQANVSILGTSACGPGGRTELRGAYTLDEALGRLLAGAPCRYRIVDARTVRIIPFIVPEAAPAPREAPKGPALVAEVVVTATKRPATLDSLPAGVSAISREQLTTTGSVEVGQTVGQLAGVLTTNLGPGRDKLLIRGLSDGAFTGRARSTVSTYLDDAPINYNAPDPDLRLVDIDRVEVVRGPQGALYGSGAVAGIYRIVTRKPNLERAEFGAMGSVSATQGGDSSHEVEGYASLPLLRDHAAVRLAAYDDVQGGYLDDTNLGETNVDQTKRSGGRLALRVQFDSRWRLDALAATQNLRSDDTQYVTTGMDTVERMPAEDGGGGAVGAPGDRANRVRETHNNDFSYAGGTLSGDFGWGSISSSLSYVHHVFSSQYDATAVIGRDIVAKEGDLGVYTEASRANLLVQDLVVRSDEQGRLDWLVGVYYARTNERSPSSLGIFSAGPAVSTVYTEARKDRLRELALYGEATYELWDGWSATVGGRLFESRVHTTADIEVMLPSPLGGPRFFDRSRTFNGLSPKISVQKTFADGDLIYALITEGYRPGGFNSAGLFAIRESRALFAADRLRNYELGAKLRRFDGRLAVRAAAYYDDWTNIQTDQYRPSGLPYTANVGDARILGLEAEVSYDFPIGLSLQLNGLLSDSKVRNPNPDFAAAGVASSLPGVPKRSGGMLAVYTRSLTDNLTLRLVGEASYVGNAGVSFDAGRLSRMDNYFRARLSAELAKGPWSLTAFVTNPLDSSSDTFAYGNPFSFSEQGVRQATPQRPRTVGLRLGAAF